MHKLYILILGKAWRIPNSCTLKSFNRRTGVLLCKKYVHKCTCSCRLPLLLFLFCSQTNSHKKLYTHTGSRNWRSGGGHSMMSWQAMRMHLWCCLRFIIHAILTCPSVSSMCLMTLVAPLHVVFFSSTHSTSWVHNASGRHRVSVPNA